MSTDPLRSSNSNSNATTADALLTQEQSAQLAGVSEETIHRFSQFGLLKSVSQGGKTPLFRREDIVSLFHIDNPIKTPSTVSESPTAPSIDTEKAAEETRQKEFVVIQGGAQEKASDIAADTHAEQSLPKKEIPDGSSEAPLQLERQEAVAQDKAQPTLNQQATAQEFIQTAQPLVPAVGQSNELLEINRMLRDQIQTLRDERDWLRERLEKLESLSEREHMLLFSNSETIRNLLIENQKKKVGFWSRALPWLK